MVNLESELKAFGVNDSELISTLLCMGQVTSIKTKDDVCYILFRDPEYGNIELERIPCKRLNANGETLEILYSFRVNGNENDGFYRRDLGQRFF
jgi:hypothetical protein